MGMGKNPAATPDLVHYFFFLAVFFFAAGFFFATAFFFAGFLTISALTLSWLKLRCMIYA